MAEKTKFKGHETFYFREGWLSKALYYLSKETADEALFSDKNAITKLGVGSNMVKAIKYWLTACGLLEFKKVENKRKYALTELGNLIANKDMYLEDIFTLWVLHINLIRNRSTATTWNVFFNEFLLDEFENEDAHNYVKHILNEQNIQFNEKSVDIDINLLLNMYTHYKDNDDPEDNSVCPFAELGLFNKLGNSYVREVPNLADLNELLFLYVIVLKCKDSQSSYVKISDLETGNLSFKVLFNVDRLIINEQLGVLENQGFIRVDRTAGLDVVYLVDENINDLKVLETYYERRGEL